MNKLLETDIIYLKKVGEKRASLLKQELNIYTFLDLLEHRPFRYEDRSQVSQIKDIKPDSTYILLKGRISKIGMVKGRRPFIKATLTDGTGYVNLVWFQSLKWVSETIRQDKYYAVWGKLSQYNKTYQFNHPELQDLKRFEAQEHQLIGVYHSTDLLKKVQLDSRGIHRLQKLALEKIGTKFEETLPAYLLEKYELISKSEAFWHVHLPQNQAKLQQSLKRLKFEELFYIQLEILEHREERKPKYTGFSFKNTQYLKIFYQKHLPFKLTDAQARVIREIYRDMSTGKQMNRLLQGDVGSGKTIVAFMVMLLAIADKAQCALMAPTEVLAEQHYQTLLPQAQDMNLKIDKLTGSTPKRIRRVLLEELQRGFIHILVGTHALIEEPVVFDKLGLCIIDEQHRFGVAQRGKLWQKQQDPYPHVLIMTATPIPRTLAMTFYGDLESSIIDKLPPGRKPIETRLYYENSRLAVWGFLKKLIEIGKQVYVVFPLVEESEHFDYKNVMEGYENIKRTFPNTQVSIVHGRMTAKDKDFEMNRFAKGETQIMVATTVIEVGIDVPNANLIIIENAERFGLSQLHQLRGRVGRSHDQSYCFLMADYKISREGRTRLKTMVETTDGFQIADVDLKLRGPGNLLGKEQSGLLSLKFADLQQDKKLLELARQTAQTILKQDRQLQKPQHQILKYNLQQRKQHRGLGWLRVS